MNEEVKNKHAVTGAFGYSGKYITEKLLALGKEVITLTNSFNRENIFGDKVKAYPFHFDEPEKLEETLRGVSVLYNTYWVRFNHKLFTHADAVRNTKVLFQAAAKAGVKRVVHVSITNPSLDSDLEYFSGKADLEKALMDSGLSYAILRPTVIFGKEDILINNIAWALRHLPVFGVFGDGKYRLQPIYVEDLAELAIEQATKTENCIINAIGPDTFSYKELAEFIGKTIGKKRPIISVSPGLGYLASKFIGFFVKDTFVTREEIKGLMDDLLYVDAAPAGKTSLKKWIEEHKDSLGKNYTSELARRKDRKSGYKGN
ncbi:MAG: NAD(P)H-binding protein [Leptospiraceae bacterium]|nr:NAD(P)H-binding protein [Leptospiraceae bacterium]MCP5500728.1 NAD(P)H-binding protein [Leptospiraceae bacterium]